MIILVICFGIAIALQSAVNARLRSYVQSPFLTAFLSFFIGTVALLAFVAIRGELSLLSPSTLFELPLWTFIGGLLGLAYLTINIVLFKKIGGVQTAVLPIFGQLIAGLLIDQYGLFYAPIHVMTWQKAAGFLLVVCGVVVVTDLLFAQLKAKQDAPFIWKAVGVAGGMLSAIQGTINGHLGSLLSSSLAAATVSFIVGTLILALLVIVTKAPLANVRAALQEGTWWMWLGGLFGAVFVLGIAFAIPKIGAGQVLVFLLFGQLFASAIIEHFGLFGAPKKELRWQKVAALCVMLVGVVLVKG